ELEPRHQERRIDAALEAIARVRIDTELAAGLRDVERLPERRFDQHVGGRLRAAGRLAAHDAGKRFRPDFVGDDAHGFVERVSLAVERGERFVPPGAAPGEIAADFRSVEHMQRPTAIEGDEVRDIDQGIDRAQPDRGQAPLQPVGRRPVLYPAHEAQRKAAAKRWRRAEVERYLAWAGKFALHRFDRLVNELAHIGGGEITRNAVHGGTVTPVGREL